LRADSQRLELNLFTFSEHFINWKSYCNLSCHRNRYN